MKLIIGALIIMLIIAFEVHGHRKTRKPDFKWDAQPFTFKYVLKSLASITLLVFIYFYMNIFSEKVVQPFLTNYYTKGSWMFILSEVFIVVSVFSAPFYLYEKVFKKKSG